MVDFFASAQRGRHHVLSRCGMHTVLWLWRQEAAAVGVVDEVHLGG
jgi:hypothetical protein